MRVPYGWLGELVAGLPPVEETADLLAGLGLGVEAILRVPGAPQGVRVVAVLAVEPVAGALQRVEIDDGGQRRTVACAAPNVRVGMRAAYAPPGTRLPGGQGVLEVREVGGVRSEGMLCSPRELGIFEHAAGLLALGDDAPVGAELAELWPADDVIELELTPNRADAFSLLGVARDVAAKLGTALRHPAAGLEAAVGDPSIADGLEVRVADPERCPRFSLRRVDGVRVGPSPAWLQRRLALLGLRPRNVVVDVTNLVTFELGQPSHAYDLEALEGGVLEVRRAAPGERLITLNDDELELDPEDLVIATPDPEGGSRAIGLAGVIGGRDDSVRVATTSVAVEVASFAPIGVRRTGKRHKLVTDARIRFERGVDPALPLLANARVTALLAQLAGGRPHPGVRWVADPAPAAPAIAFRPSQVGFLVDVEVAAEAQRRHLERLGCGVDVEAPDRWRVTPPTWRADLELEVDLVEEVARLHGYEHIGSTHPQLAFVPPATDPTHRRLRERLVGAGMVEAIGYVFTGADDLARARVPEARVRLSEPQGIERAVLRTSLLPGLLGVARLNRDAARLALFEVGHVFLDDEEERLGLLWRGHGAASGWRPPQGHDVYAAKGVLESLAEGLGANLTMRPAGFEDLHPGVSAEVAWEGAPVGRFGRLHPEVAAAWGCGDVVVAELRLPLEARPPRLRELPRQPFAERDLAVVLPVDVAYAELAARCAAAAGPRLVESFPFDVYQGPQVQPGHKSVALRFRFRHPDRALTDAEVDADMGAIMAALRDAGYAWRT
ncbi:MAG: phenylalanine--tRNA ligase subunit beta [Trueperaceae bacterium]|nr:phenylalanine--tRNA ligase subunit beta [Trueperaceae bacterium]